MRSKVLALLVALLIAAWVSPAQGAWLWVVSEDLAATTTCAPGFFLAAFETEGEDEDEDESDRIFACIPRS